LAEYELPTVRIQTGWLLQVVAGLIGPVCPSSSVRGAHDHAHDSVIRNVALVTTVGISHEVSIRKNDRTVWFSSDAQPALTTPFCGSSQAICSRFQ
jgi:hypothetical protein